MELQITCFGLSGTHRHRVRASSCPAQPSSQPQRKVLPAKVWRNDAVSVVGIARFNHHIG